MGTDSVQVLTNATLKAARALGLDEQELATAVGISVEQLAELDCHASRFQPGTETGLRCLLLIRLHAALASQVGQNQDHVDRWLRSHNKAIGEIPLVAISTQAGLIKVVAYLEQLLEGR